MADVSPQYLYYAEEAAPRIRDELGEDVAIIIILRDPAERAFSAYNHLVRDAIVVGESFRECLEHEDERIASGQPPLYHLKAVGLYAAQVATFRKLFPRVAIVLYEDLQRDPAAFFERLASTLGIAPRPFEGRANAFRKPALPRFTQLLRRSALSRSAKRLATAVGAVGLARDTRNRILSAASSSRRDSMSPEDRRYLADYFSADVRRLEAETGLDLGAWLHGRRPS